MEQQVKDRTSEYVGQVGSIEYAGDEIEAKYQQECLMSAVRLVMFLNSPYNR